MSAQQRQLRHVKSQCHASAGRVVCPDEGSARQHARRERDDRVFGYLDDLDWVGWVKSR